MANRAAKTVRTKFNSLLGLLLLSLSLLITGCAPAPAGAEVVTSGLERDTVPGVAPDELLALSSGNTDFALRLYQELREQEGNLFFSPYSISAALAMTYGSARGSTEREMAQTLGFTLPQDRLHPAFNALDLQLAERTKPIDFFGTEVEGAQLDIANSLWGQAGHSFRPEYLDLLALNYGAEMHLMDFANAAAVARRTINKWVEDATEGNIQDIVSGGALNAQTRLVLVNAIYFNAKWEDPFSKFATKKGDFYLLDGGTVRVPMMSQDEPFPYLRGRGFQVFELPYVGRELAMGILMPDTGKFRDVESSLDARQLNTIVRNLETRYLDLKMPRFDFESEFEMRDTLSEMGMRRAFGGADFSGMDGGRELRLSEVLHKAFVKVDERGTEAGAATSVFASVISNPMYPLEVTVDRPFIFWIRDIPTGTLLFLGRVLNPAE